MHINTYKIKTAVHIEFYSGISQHYVDSSIHISIFMTGIVYFERIIIGIVYM
jgi:hypothetical protein